MRSVLLSIPEFIGHFHPVLVHLPIGILLVAVLMQWMAGKEGYAGLRQAVQITLLIGILTAIASCITGYLLSLSGDYDNGLVNTHMWLAISTTLAAVFLYVRAFGYSWSGKAPDRAASIQDKPAVPFRLPERILSLAVLLLLTLTGHLGGSLTHGPGYLTAGLGADDPSLATPSLKPIADIPSAAVYADLVQPILHDNCYRCHSAEKQKGGLRLDGSDWIMKGGKDGKVIMPGQAAESELIKRLLLPLEDDHHMAPKAKPQLTKNEVALLTWWVDAGAPFDKKVGQLAQDSVIRPVLLAFHQGTAGGLQGPDNGPLNVADSDMPREPVSAASQTVISQLQTAGVTVLPIAQNSAYLEVSFLGDSIISSATLQLLASLKDQLVSLKCSQTSINDNALPVLARCTRLVRLWLDHTAITGKTLASLQSLTNLRYLNLSGTAVTSTDLLVLRPLPKLATLYLFQTVVDKPHWMALQQSFPHTRLDSGGYVVPLLPQDTTIVTAPAVRHSG